MRFRHLIAVLSMPLIVGFTPLNTYRAAVDAARAACAKLAGKKLADFGWEGAAPPPIHGPGSGCCAPDGHWQLWAVNPSDDRPGPPHWYFKVDLPASGAEPNKCVKNGATPTDKLEAPIPPVPKPRPVAPNHAA
jgi:hypothetical protein